MIQVDDKEAEFFRARAAYYINDKPVPETVAEVPRGPEPEPEVTSPPPIEAEWPVGLQKIKLIARSTIMRLFPDWKQVNMTARSVELTRAGIAGNLTAGEQAEEAAIQAAWNWVKSVRAHSGTMEAAYEAAEDKQGFDYMAGWPNFHMEEPVPVEMPAFLLEPEVPEAVEEPEVVPVSLLDLVRENEAYGDTQTRLWELYLELNGKLMLGLATEEDARLHTRLHGHLAWISKGAAEVVT
jgi:hypothetical protein